MYLLQSFPNWKIVALADGCNWVQTFVSKGLFIAYINQGPRPKGAAWKAGRAFVEFVISQSKAFTDTKSIGYAMR